MRHDGGACQTISRGRRRVLPGGSANVYTACPLHSLHQAIVHSVRYLHILCLIPSPKPRCRAHHQHHPPPQASSLHSTAQHPSEPSIVSCHLCAQRPTPSIVLPTASRCSLQGSSYTVLSLVPSHTLLLPQASARAPNYPTVPHRSSRPPPGNGPALLV